MNITIEKATKNQVNVLLDIYDDANQIFDSSYRASGTLDIFHTILNENEVHIMYSNKEPIGFCAYRISSFVHIEAMYIKRGHQRCGLGQRLLQTIYDNTEENNIYTLDALKNAPWSIEFYKKNGYEPYDPEIEIPSTLKEVLQQFELHSWSQVMYLVKK